VSASSDPAGWRVCNGIFYLFDPPSGTGDVEITLPNGDGGDAASRHAGAFVLYNIAAEAPEAVADSGGDSVENPIATSLAGVSSGSWTVDVVSQGSRGVFEATDPGQVVQWQLSCAGSTAATSTLAVGREPVVTLGWDHSRPRRYAHALAAFAAAVPSTLGPTTVGPLATSSTSSSTAPASSTTVTTLSTTDSTQGTETTTTIGPPVTPARTSSRKASLEISPGPSPGRAQAISFQGSILNGTNLTNPTSLQFGPDGRLYVGATATKQIVA
jgi:hypothetical protein